MGCKKNIKTLVLLHSETSINRSRIYSFPRFIIEFLQSHLYYSNFIGIRIDRLFSGVPAQTINQGFTVLKNI